MLVALTVLCLALSTGTPRAAAQPVAQDKGALTALAGDPETDPPIVGYHDYTFSNHGKATAGALARTWVHGASRCGYAFCTIQQMSDRYRVFTFSICGTVALRNFVGLYDSHNHMNKTVVFLDSRGVEIGWYRAGMRDPVNWNPVYYVRVCN
ncbi:hypothetical protein [Actinomadura sp. 7K534]|uniref:hypothetical protein n=1 Tax=Actinomadura sp. 7K534 TaxID=2530366 RepID=UPI00104847C0|nr:hypothetical protein [Actinomadura sp. 7K534]TDB94150.1 hypothetical protein E1266_17750 [Actinomadura sp. 7K534]